MVLAIDQLLRAQICVKGFTSSLSFNPVTTLEQRRRYLHFADAKAAASRSTNLRKVTELEGGVFTTCTQRL